VIAAITHRSLNLLHHVNHQRRVRHMLEWQHAGHGQSANRCLLRFMMHRGIDYEKAWNVLWKLHTQVTLCHDQEQTSRSLAVGTGRKGHVSS
jgi:hypothetical protein